jgi:ferredoxin--NADP+ reductase/benzoate/toluate 1,2-dioxygenase reductase subunit
MPRVIEVRDLTPSVYVLRVERCGMPFHAGQYIRLGADAIHMREYTVYSAPEADHLDALIKEVQDGTVSHRLRLCRPGDTLALDGPFGSFLIDPRDRERRFLFIAAGTGIAPFRCFVSSYPDLDYHVLHGVRSTPELYAREAFDKRRYTACLSRDDGCFPGRVTDYLRAHPVDPHTLCYLCGGYPMIAECFGILRAQGLPPDHLHAEVYF